MKSGLARMLVKNCKLVLNPDQACIIVAFTEDGEMEFATTGDVAVNIRIKDAIEQRTRELSLLTALAALGQKD